MEPLVPSKTDEKEVKDDIFHWLDLQASDNATHVETRASNKTELDLIFEKEFQYFEKYLDSYSYQRSSK